MCRGNCDAIKSRNCFGVTMELLEQNMRQDAAAVVDFASQRRLASLARAAGWHSRFHRLDPMSENLHLVVNTAQEFDRAITRQRANLPCDTCVAWVDR